MSDTILSPPEKLRLPGLPGFCYRVFSPWSVARIEAIQRREAKGERGTCRFKIDQFYEDTIGVQAEIAFCKMTGLRRNSFIMRGGDGGVDMVASIMLSGRMVKIDVKGYRKPFNLLLKEHEIARVADILVLAQVESDYVTFLGWDWGLRLVACPKKDFGIGELSHYKPREDLEPIDDLLELLGVNLCQPATNILPPKSSAKCL